MERGEILHRVREQVHARQYVPPTDAAARPITPTGVTALLLGVWKDEDTLRAQVDQMLDTSSVTLMGQKADLPIDWSDVRLWPESASLPGPRATFRNRDGLDPKFAWEVQRLLYLIPLAASVRLGHRASECVAVVAETLSGWERSSRPGYGITWGSGIEVALSSIALATLIELLPEQLTEDVSRAAAAHLVAADDFLKTFPSLFSSANNHRVAELAGILFIRKALRSNEGAEVLERELADVLQNLFATDGIGLEQSPTYAAFTVEMAALVLATHAFRDESAESRIREISVAGLRAVEAFVENGTIMRYGDDDQGRVFCVESTDGLWLDTIAALLNVERLCSGGTHVFAAGGTSVLRVGTTALTLDHGPLGFGSLAAHGHADALHISLWIDGDPWIVDPGTFVYHGDGRRRDHFRSAAAHNGPRIPGAEPVLPTGAFNWARQRPDTSLTCFSTTGAELSVSARTDADGDWSFSRTVVLDAAGVRLRDTAHGQHPFVGGFLLHPACSVEWLGDDTARVSRAGARADLTVTVKTGDFPLAQRGATALFSAAYHSVAEAPQLVCASDGDTLEVVFEITPPHESTNEEVPSP